jgi:hypothetical protein
LKIPKSITDAIMKKYGKFPIALTGCRTTTLALDCCEYDFVVSSDKNICELLHVDDNYAEIYAIRMKQNVYTLAPLLQNMEIVNDPSWVLTTLRQDVAKAMPKALSLYSRNMAVDALFYANRSRGKNNALLSSLWLKCAAYYYLEAVIAKNGSRPMPTHMLAQLRSISENGDSKGITIASSCIGLERANRSSVSRCMEAAIRLNESIIKSHTQIVAKKAQFLLKSGMYTDCYFYLGYITREAAVKIAAKQRIMKDYMFMINIAMDLTTDQSSVSKLANELIDSCNTHLLK